MFFTVRTWLASSPARNCRVQLQIEVLDRVKTSPKFLLKINVSQALVVYTCNPSYLGGRD
jgi:hypothetical protein